MAHVQKVEGFVLKKKSLLEKDLVVTIFTSELGKVFTMAKGARSITSRRAAHLQTGNLIKAQLSDFHDIFYIQSSELISGFLQIRTEKKLNTLYLFLYILDKLLPEKLPERKIYTYTKKFFISLSKDDLPVQETLKIALQNTLLELGYIDGSLTLRELLQTVENNIEEKLPQHVIM